MELTSKVSDVRKGYADFSVFAAMRAVSGLPSYFHAPKFFVDEYGVSLAALGTVLFLLRLVDFVQDPALGWLAERTRARRSEMVFGGVALMAVSMAGLFAVAPPLAPLLWFALTLLVLFSAYSFLTISFYAQGVSVAEGGQGHVRLATWRETGALIGVCLASVAPTVFVSFTDQPFAWFALFFAGLCFAAAWAMRGNWEASQVPQETSLRDVLSDGLARRLLLIGLLNAGPVAVSSTLFLFFVESRLDAPGWEGPLLLLFFLSAALAAPVWGRLAERYGAKDMLLSGMVLSILAFGGTGFLGAGEALPFAVVCVASGAALGADMTLLPAMFARRMATVAPAAGQAFGLWSFVTKFSLALAAVSLLPLLEGSGFAAGADNSPDALWTLTVLYALLPCVLKLLALALLWATPKMDGKE